MQSRTTERSWLWATLMLSSLSIVAVVFSIWELLEYRLFRTIDYVTLHYLYVTRGVVSSLLLACWAAWYVLRQRRRSEEELRLSRERYRGLLEASPNAVALYDGALLVSEWNAAAERLYGYRKADVLGRRLPNVPAEKEAELLSFLARVERGEPVNHVETLRRHRDGVSFEVQLSQLLFREETGQRYFLEVTEDIRDRVRLREKLLEIEKLTSMGRMAAGTAHHLNTPVAAMLLRLEMMRQRPATVPGAADLDSLEAGLRFCRHFLQRLLEFSRPAPVEKQAQEIKPMIESVAGFFSPALHARRARVDMDLDGVGGRRTWGDRNLLEALLLILLSNALDAISDGGSIVVRARQRSETMAEIQVSDDGCGIPATELPRVFEPFFSTKGPGKGTGLGLAIARNIVAAHGGSVCLDSKPGLGTTVSLELPLLPLAVGKLEVTS